MASRLAKTLAVGFGVVALYLLLWPLPFDPVTFRAPKPPPLTGRYEVNHRLTAARSLGPAGPGPEDVAFDAEGWLYTGLKDGRIMRLRPDGKGSEVFADTQGRPLGLAFDKAGRLIVADARRGLVMVEKDGSIRVLATEAQERPIVFANSVAVAADGSVYFTDSSIYPLGQFPSEWMDGRPHGRLLLYLPQSNTVRVLLDGLYFANGVALGPDESFVLVTETLAYRVSRYWLKGSARGKRDVFIDNLPGFPDNISFNGEDTFWLGLVWPRSPRMEIYQANPFIRKIALRLPASLVPWPDLKTYGFVLGLNLDGTVVWNLQDPSGKHASSVSSAREHQGMLFLGTIMQGSIKTMPVQRRPR